MKQSPKNIQQTKLNNGITLITIENPVTEIIAGKIFCRHAGSLWESNHQAGIFHLLARVMSKGTRNLSSLDIAEQVESIGSGLATDTSSDYFIASLKTITEDFPIILELVGEILRYPSFPQKEVELEKRITLQNILSQKEQPFSVAFRQLREMMYGKHPYGFSVLGTSETLTTLTAEDLRNCHRQYFRPDNLVISLAGKINIEQATELVEEIFGDWEIPNYPSKGFQLQNISSQSQYQMIEQSNQQSIIMMGYLAPEINHADYPVFKLLNTYLGNGLSSRLFVELREKRGLAYDVSSFYPTRLDKSQFVTYMGTAPSNLEIGKEGLTREITRLQDNLLTAEELYTAKNKLLGQYALGKQTNAEFAQLYGWYEILGLGVEYDRTFPEQIEAVQLEDISRIAHEYLTEDNLYTSIVGPRNVSSSL